MLQVGSRARQSFYRNLGISAMQQDQLRLAKPQKPAMNEGDADGP